MPTQPHKKMDGNLVTKETLDEATTGNLQKNEVELLDTNAATKLVDMNFQVTETEGKVLPRISTIQTKCLSFSDLCIDRPLFMDGLVAKNALVDRLKYRVEVFKNVQNDDWVWMDKRSTKNYNKDDLSLISKVNEMQMQMNKMQLVGQSKICSYESALVDCTLEKGRKLIIIYIYISG